MVVLDEEGRASHRTGFDAGPVRVLPSGTLVGSSRWRARWGEQGPGPDHGYFQGGRADAGRAPRWRSCRSYAGRGRCGGWPG
ncbi:hypothetical protein [Nonomuraea rubra]|uniref:hypothetical protein n=1 Tax=Nonomuraea rubra TaxID=46180 RepID=UPI0031E8B5E4